MSSPTARTQFNFHKRNGHSVRYTKEPFLTKDLEASAPLTSDMTVDTEVTSLTSDPEQEPNTRTYSVTSRLSATGPGWRSNMRGDYGSGDIVPVSSRDLLCWAYQVRMKQTECFVPVCIFCCQGCSGNGVSGQQKGDARRPGVP